MVGRAPRTRPNRSLAAVRANLTAYSREPFLDILARFIQCAPNMEAIREFANKSPDKWAAAVRTLGQLYGYSEKIEINNNLYVNIHSMSDAELMERLGALKPVLDLTATDTRTGQNSAASENAATRENQTKPALEYNTDHIQAPANDEPNAG